MKNTIYCLALCMLLFSSCTTDELQDTKKEELLENEHAILNTINRLTNAYGNQKSNANAKQSLQDLINDIETLALQDSVFVSLIDANYVTPLAADIDAIVTDSDGVLTNLNISTAVKSYVNTVLNTNTQTALNTLSQTIQNDVLLTSVEKAMLLDIIDLQKQNVLGNGIGDDWYKKGIIAYLQGAAQTKANAVLNTVIIQVLSQQ